MFRMFHVSWTAPPLLSATSMRLTAPLSFAWATRHGPKWGSWPCSRCLPVLTLVMLLALCAFGIPTMFFACCFESQAFAFASWCIANQLQNAHLGTHCGGTLAVHALHARCRRWHERLSSWLFCMLLACRRSHIEDQHHVCPKFAVCESCWLPFDEKVQSWSSLADCAWQQSFDLCAFAFEQIFDFQCKFSSFLHDNLCWPWMVSEPVNISKWLATQSACLCVISQQSRLLFAPFLLPATAQQNNFEVDNSMPNHSLARTVPACPVTTSSDYRSKQ